MSGAAESTETHVASMNRMQFWGLRLQAFLIRRQHGDRWRELFIANFRKFVEIVVESQLHWKPLEV